MSENRKNRMPLLIAFLAGVAVAAIVAFLLIGSRGSSTKREEQAAKQEEQTDNQEAEVSASAQQEAVAAGSTAQTAA